METAIVHLVAYGSLMDFNEILNGLKKVFVQSITPAEIVNATCHSVGDGFTGMITAEKYYMRTGSYAALSILITEADGRQLIDVVGFGGGGGMFNISWGANESFAESAVNFFIDCGYEKIPE